MTALEDALDRLAQTSKQLRDARRSVEDLDPQQTADLQAAKAAGASEAQLVERSGLSRVTVWRRLKG